MMCAALATAVSRSPPLERRRARRSSSTSALHKMPSFHPLLPRIPATSDAISGVINALDGRPTSVVLPELHARLTLARFRWFVTAEDRVPCVCVKYIEVDEAHRCQGNARRALDLLSIAAADNRLALVVHDVVSEHIDAIVQELGGTCLPGDERERNFMIPPSPHALWRCGGNGFPSERDSWRSGSRVPRRQFMHDEEPIFHGLDPIEISTSSPSYSCCGTCDSPVNGMLYYMSFASLDNNHEQAITNDVKETETPAVPETTRIYVGNMPSGCNKTYLRALLKAVDVVVLNIGINRSKLSSKHRSAFVQVNTTDAKRAVDTLDEHEFNGTALYAHIKEWDELETSPKDIMYAW